MQTRPIEELLRLNTYQGMTDAEISLLIDAQVHIKKERELLIAIQEMRQTVSELNIAARNERVNELLNSMYKETMDFLTSEDCRIDEQVEEFVIQLKEAEPRSV